MEVAGQSEIATFMIAWKSNHVEFRRAEFAAIAHSLNQEFEFLDDIGGETMAYDYVKLKDEQAAAEIISRSITAEYRPSHISLNCLFTFAVSFLSVFILDNSVLTFSAIYERWGSSNRGSYDDLYRIVADTIKTHPPVLLSYVPCHTRFNKPRDHTRKQ